MESMRRNLFIMISKFIVYAVLSFFPILDLLHLCGAENSNGVCISPGGRFPPFSIDGKPPRKVSKGSKDLTLCRVFRKKTCCDITQTHPAFLSVRRLKVTGEASDECAQLWELLECSICDPKVGVKPGPPEICSSFCEKLFQACSSAYFSEDTKTQVLVPCRVSDFICGKASKWVSNGTELCHAAGFSVKLSDAPDASCYGGKASLDSIADSWSGSDFRFSQEADLGLLENLQQWVKEMPLSNILSWAIGGMVLTAGLTFYSKRRKSHNQRLKLAAIQRSARKLEEKFTMKPSLSQGYRKSIRR